MAGRQGATDTQIADGEASHISLKADALQQGLPQLTQATTTQPALLAADAFAAALEAIPAEDWCRTWAAGRTIMLRRTSKRVKEVVDKMRLPVVVRLSRSFWGDVRNGTATKTPAFRACAQLQRLQIVLRHITALTANCRITTLELPRCVMNGQDAERLAAVLGQCPALAHLDLSKNRIRETGAESLARVLGQCPALAHLNLGSNDIGAVGAESLAGVLGHCTSLAHLNLGSNDIGAAGAAFLAGGLGQCASLAHLNLGSNDMGAAGAESLAGVLGQCPALAHLNLRNNWIGEDGVGKLAEVLPRCPALAYLNLEYNGIGDAGAKRLMGAWSGPEGGLFLDSEYR
jgi:Ran GTPase-activating protein (RanGAP) involved in mRNA processing and transport